MSDQPTPLHLRVFLSSPGDVTDERSIALQVLERIQYDPLLRGKITVEVVAWDKPGADTPMLATMTPQEAINLGLPTPAMCDIVVVIFWSRMGTPLPDDFKKPDGNRYLSGTEWEYENAMQAYSAAGKPMVVIYRRTERLLLDPADPGFQRKLEQWQRVDAFFAGFVNPDGSIRQGYNSYQTPDDFRDKFETHLKGLVKRLLDETPPQVEAPEPASPIAPLWEGSPFPGLRAFEPKDAPIFFGRGAETDALVKRLSDPACRLIAVVGASGSGKSSLVGAGLIPRLAANAIEGSRDWSVVRFTPGELASGDPFEALVVALVRDLPSLRADGVLPRELTQQLHAGPEVLEEIVQKALADRSAWGEIVLFIDQFEELFSLVRPQHVEPFIKLLTDASATSCLRAVLTLRADFYAKCVEKPALAELLETTTYPLAAPEIGALYEMIARPADLAGLSFEDGLVNRILDDTGAEPGALALMAYTLDELYRACAQPKCLTHAVYQSLGGVQGAIGQRAENTFARLDGDAQASLPSVFQELAEVDERGVAIRRRASLEQVTRTEAAGRLVEALTGARLLVQGREEDQRPVVEVAHEALLRSWGRLATWIDDTQDDLRLLRQVRLGAEEWERAGRNPTELLTGRRLERAQQWLTANSVEPSEREFLEASIAEDERRKQAEQDRQMRELEMQRELAEKRRQSANRLRILAAGLMVFLVVALGLAAWALDREEKANINLRQAWDTQALFLADLSRQRREADDTRQALLLAQEGVTHYHDGIYNAENYQALLGALFTEGLEGLYLRHEDPVSGAAWNGDETRLLTWSEDGTARVWDAASGDPLLTLRHEWFVDGATWNGDETRLLTSSWDRTARVWDAASGDALLTLRHENIVYGAAWNGDETRLLTWSEDGTARVWDAASGEALLTLHHVGGVWGAAWNGDETRLLTWSDDGTARVWDAASGETLLTLRHDPSWGGVYGAAWNGDETCLLTWSDDGTARVWDAADGTELLTLRHEDPVSGAAWNGDETRLLTWSEDGTARVWDAASGDPLLTLRHDDIVMGAAWNRDETRLLTWNTASLSCEGNCFSGARVWDAASGDALLTLRHDDPVDGAAWNADETRLLTWSKDGTARVWDMTNNGDALHTQLERVNPAEFGDETQMLTWLEDGTWHSHPVDLDQLIGLANSLNIRPLTNEERAQFFLPTLEPTITPTPLPTVTPLPTLTPSPIMPTITPLPTLTPSPTATP